MNKTQMTYFEKNDIIHIALSKEEEANSFEISPYVTAELNNKGELIGIEIVSAVEKDFNHGSIHIQSSIRF